MSKESIRKHIQALLQERYGDLSYWSDFDRNEFQGDAMRAAMDDMKDDGMNVEPLGKSRYEQDLDIDDMISDLERAKLGLPNESKKYKALQKQIDHLSRMGAGSLNEKTNEFSDPERIEEHDVVYLLEPVGDFKAGAKGTVVHKYNDGETVEVEFVDRNGTFLGLEAISKYELSKNAPTNLDEYMSPDAFSTKQYGQILPDKQIDLYYNRVADDLANGRDTKDIVRTLVRLNGGKLPPTVQTLFDNAQNMYESEEINPDAVDTTNLYKFLKDAIHQMASKGFSEEKIAQNLEIILQKNFNIQKKNAVFSVNESNPFDGKFDKYHQVMPDELVDTFYSRVEKALGNQASIDRELNRIKSINGNVVPPIIQALIDDNKTLDEVFTGTDYEFYADDVEPFLKKGINYSYTDFGKAFAQTNNAALHSLDMNSIIDVLIGRGYSVEKYVGESSAISQTIKKGTNAKPNGPAHTILSQEGDGISKVIEKGTNVKPIFKRK